MSKITEDQRSIIDSFKCERLSENLENRELIKRFVNKRGKAIVEYLQQFAWDEDQNCTTAYYLIKSSDNNIVAFFSLKCGALFEPLDEDEIRKNVQRFGDLVRILQGLNKEGTEREIALQLLEWYRSGRNISIDLIKQKIKLTHRQSQIILKKLNDDKKQEANPQIIRVNHTYPGIEIVHFCINEAARDIWEKYNFRHPLGEVIFWKYIVPIICSIQKIVGCQYVFLFAADTSEDGTLVNYYNVSLKFSIPTEIGTNKPSYDFCCNFMCQELKELKENQQEYFDNFNPSEDDIIA